VTPMRIFVPTEEEKTSLRDAINQTVYSLRLAPWKRARSGQGCVLTAAALDD
jgi:hypothetical protein